MFQVHHAVTTQDWEMRPNSLAPPNRRRGWKRNQLCSCPQAWTSNINIQASVRVNSFHKEERYSRILAHSTHLRGSWQMKLSRDSIRQLICRNLKAFKTFNTSSIPFKASWMTKLALRPFPIWIFQKIKPFRSWMKTSLTSRRSSSNKLS